MVSGVSGVSVFLVMLRNLHVQVHVPASACALRDIVKKPDTPDTADTLRFNLDVQVT